MLLFKLIVTFLSHILFRRRMDKDFWVLSISSIVFYCFSVLGGLHISYLFSFFLNTNSQVHKETMSLFYFGTPYTFSVTGTEVIHMKEVGELILLSHALLLLFIPLIVFVLWYLKKSKLQLNKVFFIVPLSLGAISLFVIPFFSYAFDIFHKILFRNDYWQFPYDSIILSAYPHSFFIVEFIIILAFSLLILFTIYRFLNN